MAVKFMYKWSVVIATETAKVCMKNTPIILQYAKAELTPPKLSQLGEVKQGFQQVVSSAKTGAWKNLTVKDAWLNFLVGFEITLWFFVGEIIGRRHWVGYEIKY